MKNAFLVILVFFFAIISAFAGGEAEEKEGPVTLQILQVPAQMWKGFEAINADWKEKTGNKIEVNLIPENQYEQVLITRINAKEAPDIFYTKGAPYEVLLPPGSVEPLNERSWVERIPEATKDLMYYSDGTLPYVPLVPLNAAGVAYNKDIFNKLGLEEPKNRKDFLTICETIKNDGTVPFNYQGHPQHSWGLRFLCDPMYAYYDKYYAEEDHWEKLNTGKKKYADVDFYQKGLSQLIEYIELGYVNEDYMETTFDMTKDRFANGDVAMCLVAEWIVGAVRERNPDFNMGFFPLPVEDDREGVLASFIGDGIAVWSGSKKKEYALDYIDFLCNKESQEKFYTLTPGTPIFEDVEVSLTPIGEAIMKNAVAENTSPRLMMKDKLFSDTPYRKALEAMFSFQTTPQEMLESWDEARKNIAQQRGVEGF